MRIRMMLLAGVASFLTTPALAQTTDPVTTGVADDAETEKQSPESSAEKDRDAAPELIVTGTRIARPNMASNAPITVVDQAFLRERGIARVEDALSQIPQITPILGLQGNGWTSGRAGINLRRLGQGRTLTLLNGQRMDNDVNIVPGALIERIDILTGGASAVYGSDAIAGVVNFVLKRRFNGIVFDAEASGIQHRNDNATMLRVAEEAGYPRLQRNYFGAGQFFASLAAGKDFFDGRLNVSGFATWKESKPLQLFDLDTSVCPLRMNPLNPPLNDAGQPQFNNDTYACDTTEYNPYHYFGVTRDGVYSEFSNAVDGSRSWRPFDPLETRRVGRNDFIQRADKSISAGGFLTADLFADVKLDANFLWTRSRQSAQIAETNAFYTGDVAINCDNPLLSGQQASLLCGPNAGLAGAFSDPTTVVLWRENYIRDITPRFWNWRGSAALSGTITGKIRFEASYQRSRDIYRNRETNVYPFDFDQLARGLRVRNVNGVPTCLSKIDGTDPTCVPVDAFSAANPPGEAVWNWLTRTGENWQQNDLEVYNGVVSGTLEEYGLKSPFATNGIGFAVVGELRNVRSQSQGSGAYSVFVEFDGKATVREIAGELDIPLIEDRPFFRELSINGGYRLSDYTTYEKLVHTWKAEATWAPFDGLRFRGSYNRAVRVPVLERLEGENRYPGTFALDLCAPPGPATVRSSRHSVCRTKNARSAG